MIHLHTVLCNILLYMCHWCLIMSLLVIFKLFQPGLHELYLLVLYLFNLRRGQTRALLFLRKAKRIPVMYAWINQDVGF